MGRAKLISHDLALEMSRLSETSENLASEKQVQARPPRFRMVCHDMYTSWRCTLLLRLNRGVGDVSCVRLLNTEPCIKPLFPAQYLSPPPSLCHCPPGQITKALEKQLSHKSAELQRCRAEVAELRKIVGQKSTEGGEQRAALSKANAAARQAKIGLCFWRRCFPLPLSAASDLFGVIHFSCLRSVRPKHLVLFVPRRSLGPGFLVPSVLQALWAIYWCLCGVMVGRYELMK